jgi:basic membrane protein A
VLAFEAGLQAVDPSFTVDYVPTGDFDDVAAATEAFNNARSGGTGAVYPFLGGAHEPVVQLANESGLITMSAGASDACDRSDLDYQIAVRFDGGDYIEALFDELLAGEFTEGEIKTFHVGVDPEPGAAICDASPEQQDAMDEINLTIASGDLGGLFAEIKSEAYGS